MGDSEIEREEESSGPSVLGEVWLQIPYIPDFLLQDVQYWLVPSFREPAAAFHELTGPGARNPIFQALYSKKGWSFVHGHDRQEADGPFRVKPEGIHVEIVEAGRFFAARPRFRLRKEAPWIPLPSLEKRRPINPWKPNYLQALNFIRKYEWPHPLPRAVNHAIWEIEECGQVAGSVSWRNGEIILRDHDSRELRQTLSDIFYNRPEDYPLGSEVYLRILGLSGPEGFAQLIELASHPVSRKRKVVASTLGELRLKEAIPTALILLEDEDPEVRKAALRAIGKIGIDASTDPEGKVAAYLQSPDIPERVWAAQALLKGGDEPQEKYLVGLVKEEPRLLTDMGELGEVLTDLGLAEAVPYLIARLKHEKSEFRADANEALASLTGVDLGIHTLDTDDDRRNAIKAYSRWWEDRKRQRRLDR